MNRRSVLSLFSVFVLTPLSGCLFGAAHRGQPDRISGHIDNWTEQIIEPTVLLTNLENDILYQGEFVVEPSEGINSEKKEFEYKNPESQTYLLEVSFEDRETKTYRWEIACNTRLQISVNSDEVNIGDSIC
mgnify:CR=1 FL=1